MLVLVSAVLILFISCARCHFDDEAGVRRSSSQHRFRVLLDDVEPDFSHLNLTSEHRRLTTQHWLKIKGAATHERLAAILHQNKNYQAAQPFPHMSAMDVFPKDVLDAVHLEIPDNPKRVAGQPCIVGAVCFNAPTEMGKNAFFSEADFGPATMAVFAFMQSAAFVRFLEKLTGITDIIPDDELNGAGIHQTISGGHLDIHADFNFVKNYGLHRRVNVFLYVNPDWKDEYGGHLELWSRDLKNCSARISPDMGRLAVFSTTDFSYHGHQSALTCPPDRSRRSLAMYYYTATRPSHECIDNNCFGGHSTLFQKTQCPSCSDDKCYVKH